jgi:hypothetical protein
MEVNYDKVSNIFGPYRKTKFDENKINKRVIIKHKKNDLERIKKTFKKKKNIKKVLVVIQNNYTPFTVIEFDSIKSAELEVKNNREFEMKYFSPNLDPYLSLLKSIISQKKKKNIE